jgi:hypothetical protein
MNPRENNLRSGGTDINADRGERDIILPPQRIVLNGAIIVIEIMVMVVVGIARVDVRRLEAVNVIGQGVRLLAFLVFGHRLGDA